MSEYAVATELILVLKPKGISHVEAASLGYVALTALQCFEKMELEGGVGSLACQMAKNIFGAAKVITTVSTEKVGKVDKLSGNGVVDRSLSILL
jgi:NADPH:quinone reductase-like Zn-dependent oxidoreductase